MSDFTYESTIPPFKNRKTLLVVFGVIQLCFGAFCALLTALMVMGAMATLALGEEAAKQGLQTGSMLTGVVVYGLIASWFISMGYGSLNGRRWARSLTLAASWLALVCGGLGTASMLFFMPDMLAQMEQQGAMPPGFANTMAATMVVFAVFFYIVVPGTLLLVYSGKNVKATCEYMNPVPCWTDECPLPVLIQTVLLGGYAVGVLSMAGYSWITPFFGAILSGFPGAIAILSISLSCAYLARGCYRLQMRAWWGAVALILFWSISASITFLQKDLMDLYFAMGMPEEQLELMRPVIEEGGIQSVMFWAIPVWVAGILAFFAYTKRFFDQAASEAIRPSGV